ncbi:MAG: sensor histidine kinase [Beijerinckiaceae bacterium]
MPDLASHLQADDTDAFRTLVECAPAMLWLGDQNGHCVFLNREQRRFWGVGDADLSGFDWGSTVHPDDLSRLAEPYMQAMADQAPFEVEARYRRFDGVYRILRTSARPRFSPSGAFVGMAGVNTDVTEQRQAEEALRRSSEQLQLALDASQGIGTWVWDVERNLVVADHRFAKAFGVDIDEVARGVPMEAFFAAIVEDDRARVETALRDAMREHAVYRCEYRVRTGDGRIRWLLAAGRCEFDPAGKPTRFPGAVVDISERKAVEEHKELLANELSHRIKNIFTVVQGMTAMSAREHMEARAAFDELAGRFRAMAAAYACVTPSVDGLTVSGKLSELLGVLFAPYASNGVHRVKVEGADVEIGPKAASALALILHERATNAAKYGALSRDGLVLLRIEQRDDRYEFSWRETGGPEITEPPKSQGFGSRVIRSAVASLDGALNLEWARDGLRWTMMAPADKLRL